MASGARSGEKSGEMMEAVEWSRWENLGNDRRCGTDKTDARDTQ